MNLRIVAFLAIVALAGCSSTGVEVSQQQAQSFKPGVSTQANVQTQLGAPTTKVNLGDGRSIWVYAFSASKVKPATFIPLVGAFVGGADAHATSATFTFDQAGKLANVRTSESNYGSAMGTTTTSAPLATDQPRTTQ